MRGLEDCYGELKKRYTDNPKESWGGDRPLLPPKAGKLYDAPEFIDHGFEMVEHLRDNWSSNTEEDTFINFLSFIDMTQRPGALFRRGCPVSRCVAGVAPRSSALLLGDIVF